MIKKYLTATLIVMLVGCGFHLRGSFSLPEGLTAVTIIPDTPYKTHHKYLIQNLKQYNVEVNTNSQRALRIELSDTTTNESPISYGATGLPEKILLTMSMNYRLINSDGSILKDWTTINKNREINVNPNTIMANSSEIQLAEEELNKVVVYELLRQVSRTTIN